MRRVLNLGAGPATLPETVLEAAAEGVREIAQSGMSVLEISHRGPEYEAIHEDAAQGLLRLMGVDGAEYSVLFLGGGASLQFLMVPMNFLGPHDTAAYLDSGSWSAKAVSEARRIGNVSIVGTSAEALHTRLPETGPIPPEAKYVHMTTNNTIEGTQWRHLPAVGTTPLIADASSDFLSRALDHRKCSLLYAGAQKNAGPAGVTIVVVRRTYLETARTDIAPMLSYRVHEREGSLYNTPPVFGVFVIGLMCRWIRDQGGLEALEARNREKAELIYSVLDANTGVYEPVVTDARYRSHMNVTFRLHDGSREREFLAAADAAGIVGLKGHRSVGGFRASIYNALPVAGAGRFAQLLEEFALA